MLVGQKRIFLAFVLLASIACVGPATLPDGLLAVPKSLDQIKVERPLRESHKSEFASHDAGERLNLAHAFQKDADAAQDPATKFVQLRLARDLAASGGDLPLAMSIVDDIAGTFIINADEMKASALALAVDTARVSPDVLAQSYLKVADDALAAWKIDLASKAAYLAVTEAKGYPELLALAKDRERTVRLRKTELKGVFDAQRKLARNADDPAANLIVGRFLCLRLNQWETGLPYLSKSVPGPLKTLAERDQAMINDAARMADLADAWWDYADSKSGIPAGAARQRAAHWYTSALPGLAGDRKSKAQKRIAEVESSREKKKANAE